MEYLIWGILLITLVNLFSAISKIWRNKPFNADHWAVILAGMLVSSQYYYLNEFGLWFKVVIGMGYLALIFWFVEKYFIKILKRGDE